MIKYARIHEEIPVVVYDKETQEIVGEYSSIEQCARKMFIKCSSSIGYQITKQSEKGLESYKDGKKYFFKRKERSVYE